MANKDLKEKKSVEPHLKAVWKFSRNSSVFVETGFPNLYAATMVGLGTAGMIGAAVVTWSMCQMPCCTAPSGQCCLLRQNTKGVFCPRYC